MADAPSRAARPPLTIAFGRFADGGKIAGRYHAPVGVGVGAGVGVVLCGPGGVEESWTYATFRSLAERLAERGVPVLRFDYHGQGDSSGDDRSPGRVQAWKDSIAFAIDELVARSGVTRVSLFGLRLGATLAATVAAERGDVAGLALWAPVAGRPFMREFRAYRLLNPPAPAPERYAREGEEEAAGFLLTAETQMALGNLDVVKLEKRPAERVLLLPKDESSSEDKIAKRLESLGAAVEQQRVPGYAAMMREPRKVVRPEVALDVLTDWFCALDGPPPTPSASSPEPAALVTRAPYATGATVREEPLRFGADDRLFGVLTEPIERGPRARTALLLLTIAHYHRVGVQRTHVTFAREAAARGFSAFRLDVRGVGDSLSPTGPPHPYAIEPVADVVAAMDALRQRGVERFVLAGLCSGAFLAYHGALADPRASGVTLLNPQVFYFKEGTSLDVGRGSAKSTRSYLEMITSPESWRRLARGEVNARFIAGMVFDRLKSRIEVRAADALGRLQKGPRKTPSVRRDFEAICRRGGRALLVFSAVDEGIDYIETHLGAECKAMRGHPEFEMKIVEGPDHSFVPVWSQERICEIVCEELETHYG